MSGSLFGSAFNERQMNCPVCLSPSTAPAALVGADYLFETSSRPFQLSGCQACHSLFIDPLPGDEEIASFYPAQYWWSSSSSLLKTLERTYRRIALRDHVAFIMKAARSLPADQGAVRLLDVGCGNGTLLNLMKGRGLDVLGFDSSAQASEIAKRENGVEVKVGARLQDMAFPAGSFDLVTLFHVMEHVTDPRGLLVEIRRILRPQGRIVLQVPNIESWQFRLFGARWYGLDIPRHVIDYSTGSMQRLLRESHLSVCRIRHFNLRDNAPALASSLVPSLDPLSRGIRQRRRNASESVPMAWLRHFLYLGLVVTSYPFAIAESAAGAGATIMIEAARE
jgi:2-polyprenyl-3-methyl-5-hydroxy-6-metoxy-1,4-benzoquinol methylase